MNKVIAKVHPVRLMNVGLQPVLVWLTATSATRTQSLGLGLSAVVDAVKNLVKNFSRTNNLWGRAVGGKFSVHADKLFDFSTHSEHWGQNPVIWANFETSEFEGCFRYFFLTAVFWFRRTWPTCVHSAKGWLQRSVHGQWTFNERYVQIVHAPQMLDPDHCCRARPAGLTALLTTTLFQKAFPRMSQTARLGVYLLSVYLRRTCSRVTSASSALGVLNDYAPYKSAHSLGKWLFFNGKL